MATESVHITPIAGEKPSQFAERVGRGYADASIQKDKKHKGQFFTPLAISQFMGNLASSCGKKSVSVLDPGCGLAILSCALIEHLAQEAATELRMMPLPPIETIREIGRKIILRNNYSIDYINDLVLDYFKIQ